jgi:DHA2 family multidrug resistance protein
LRHEEFAFGFVVSFVPGFALFGSPFLIPAFTLQVLQFTARDVGPVLLPGALTVGLELLTSGFVIQLLRAPPVLIVPFGIGIFMSAMRLLSGFSAESGYLDLLPTLVLRGFGRDLLFIAITMICLGDLTGAEIPHGVGLFNLGRQMGGLIGVAFLTTFLEHHMALSRTALSAILVWEPGARASRGRDCLCALRPRFVTAASPVRRARHSGSPGKRPSGSDFLQRGIPVACPAIRRRSPLPPRGED